MTPDDPQELTYPRRWEYRLIGRDDAQMLAAIAEILQQRDHALAPGHDSAKGNYHSLSVELEVADAADRDRLFVAFREHEAVVYVL